MTSTAPTQTRTLADLIPYQNQLVRTGDYLPLGRMSRIAIGDDATFTPPAGDPVIAAFGRLLDLRGAFLPIGQSRDRSQILVISPLLDFQGRVRLPDLPNPSWKPPAWTEDEVTGKVERSAEADQAPMLEQRLRDRTNRKLEKTNFLIFQPVLRITFQLEADKKLQPVEHRIDFRPEANGTHCAFLVDEATGECHFLGGVPVYGGDARGGYGR